MMYTFQTTVKIFNQMGSPYLGMDFNILFWTFNGSFWVTLKILTKQAQFV